VASLKKSLVGHVRKLNLFSKLSEDEFKIVEINMATAAFKEGEQMFLPKGTPTYLFVVLKGSVALVKYTEDGKEFMLEMYGEGDVIDVASNVNGSFTIKSDCIIGGVSLRLPVTKTTPFLEGVLKLARERVNTNLRRMSYLLHPSPLLRLECYLIDLAYKVGVRVPNGLEITELPTHKHMAYMLNLTRECITRNMTALRVSDGISVTGKTMFLNWSFLDKGDYKY